jgi:hypothetical protein
MLQKRSHTVAFSKVAVVRMMGDQLFLFFRVGNMRRSHIIDGQIRAVLVQHQRKDKRNTYQMGLHEIKVRHFRHHCPLD